MVGAFFLIYKELFSPAWQNTFQGFDEAAPPAKAYPRETGNRCRKVINCHKPSAHQPAKPQESRAKESPFLIV
jgi:hypothetical protein